MSHVIYDVQGHEIHRRYVTTSFPCRGSLSARGKILGFSPSSASRMRRYLRCCVADYRVFITLTYPFVFPFSGTTTKRHLDLLLKRYRYASKDDDVAQGRDPGLFSAFWFLEFQHRGAPHFHIFGTHEWDKERLARAWYEIVGSDDFRHYQAGTRIESIRSGRYGMCAYAGKYAVKSDQKEIPSDFANCGRFWGVSGLKKTHAATILFNLEKGKNDLHEGFLSELRVLLKTRIREYSIKRWGIGRAMILVRTEPLQLAVEALFHRYGAKAVLADDADFESPILGLIEETAYDLSIA